MGKEGAGLHTGPGSAWPIPPCNTRAACLFHPSTPSAEVGAHLNLAQAALNGAQPLILGAELLVGVLQGRLDAIDLPVGFLQGCLDVAEALIHLVRQLQGRGWDRWAGQVEGGGWYAAHSRCVGAWWPGGEARQQTSDKSSTRLAAPHQPPAAWPSPKHVQPRAKPTSGMVVGPSAWDLPPSEEAGSCQKCLPVLAAGAGALRSAAMPVSALPPVSVLLRVSRVPARWFLEYGSC